ncbi:MAG: hypothetical protein ACTSUE_13265, partial [Promethearchaeota archaeon]
FLSGETSPLTWITHIAAIMFHGLGFCAFARVFYKTTNRTARIKTTFQKTKVLSCVHVCQRIVPFVALFGVSLYKALHKYESLEIQILYTNAVFVVFLVYTNHLLTSVAVVVNTTSKLIKELEDSYHTYSETLQVNSKDNRAAHRNRSLVQNARDKYVLFWWCFAVILPALELGITVVGIVTFLYAPHNFWIAWVLHVLFTQGANGMFIFTIVWKRGEIWFVSHTYKTRGSKMNINDSKESFASPSSFASSDNSINDNNRRSKSPIATHHLKAISTSKQDLSFREIMVTARNSPSFKTLDQN